MEAMKLSRQSFTTKCSRLSIIYEYRYCQILALMRRIFIKHHFHSEGWFLGAADRRESVEPAIQSMYLMLEIAKDKILNRWCATQDVDHIFNADAIRHALKVYPEAEREYLEEAVRVFKV